MLTLPPAHTLGAALSKATAGALGSLLTIVAICAPLLLLWLGCRWLEQRLSLSMPPDAADGAAGGAAAGGDDAQLTVTTTPTSAPSLRALRSMDSTGWQTLGQTLMSPLTLSDLDLAQVATFPALPAAPAPPAPDDAPSATRPSAFPLYQPPAAARPAAPSSQPEQPYQPERAWDNWPPRGKPGQYPYRYIFVGSVLVRVASLYPYIAGDVQHDIWN